MKRAAALAAALLGVLAACNPQPPKVKPAASAAHARTTATPLVLEVTGQGTAQHPVHVFQQVHNRIDYDLLASSYESNGAQGSTRAVFSDARVTFRDPKGSTIRARAPRAIVDQTTKTVTLLDGVFARTSSGATLQCDQLVYDQAGSMLHGTSNVVVTDTKGFRATGSSVDSDLSLTHVRMQ